jgi:ElaB/YqjD/DUF883 family membrane-anchored ribosome-binding protein
MPAETVNADTGLADEVGESRKTINDAAAAAEQIVRDAAKRMEKTVRDAVATLREQAGPYREAAGEQFEEAQRVVVEAVKERPVTAALAGLGVGMLLGLLLARNSR